MVATRGRVLAAQSSATQDARENNVKQVPKKGKPHRTNRPKIHETSTSTSSARKREFKRGRTNSQLTDKIGGASSGVLMDMPVEIFLEICSHLDSLGLRYMALMNKMFRDLLMTKVAKRIWEKALASDVDLPNCPTDLNEPQFVRLMYSSECYTSGCISQGIRLDCFYRIRLCMGCFDAKMTNESGLYKIEDDLYHHWWFRGLMQYFDSWQVRNFPEAIGLELFMFSGGEKNFYFDEVKDVFEEYKALLGGSSAKESVTEYEEQLKDQTGYRALTGAAMFRWDAARRHARFESVKAKLEDAGWNHDEFPFECQEWLHLIFGDQQLTQTAWQNIEPELAPLLQRNRDKRLEQERRDRESKRKQDFSQLYNQTAYDTLRVWYTCWRLCSFAPDENSILALPRVRGVVEADTDGISIDQWTEVEDEVRTRVRKHWRIILRRVLTVVETGTAPPRTEDNIKPHEDESEEQLLGEIEDMMGKLSRVTASFVCKSDTCHELHWFPDVFLHGFCMNPAADLSELLRYCDPLDTERRRLVKRMLLDLGLDAEIATAADVKGLKNLICTRCDPTVATYSSFAQIAKHYIVLVDQAKRANLVFSGHDWLTSDVSLVRQDNETERASIASLHPASQTQATASSEA